MRLITVISTIFIIFNSYLLYSQNSDFTNSNEYKLFKVGENYFTERNYKIAKKMFRKLLLISENKEYKLKSYNYLIKIAKNEYNFKDAIKYTLIIIKKFPEIISLSNYYLKIANLYYNIGEKKSALQFYNYIIIKFPDSFEAQVAKFKIESFDKK